MVVAAYVKNMLTGKKVRFKDGYKAARSIRTATCLYVLEDGTMLNSHLLAMVMQY